MIPGPHYDPVLTISFTGEKTPGETSPTKNYIPDYSRLAAKSWQAYHESEVAQIVINNDLRWVIGSGLQLKAAPKENVLKNLGVNPPGEEFSRDFEELFDVYKKSVNSVWSRTKNLDENAKLQRLCKIVGGDALNVWRYTDDRRVSVQTIDGRNVVSPHKKIDLDAIKLRGNKVIHGVEINENGEHIAYWVRTSKGKLPVDSNYVPEILSSNYEIIRILARGEKTGKLFAKLCYGNQYRVDEVRGMPLLSVLIETISKMDRYRDAVIGSAEERQKVPYFFQHGEKSTGENVLDQNIANAAAIGMPVAPETTKQTGYNGYAVQADTAQKVAMTTNKTVLNMPIDATIKAIESKNELYFKDFFQTNFGYLCAVVRQPPEVALQAFDSNFSSSRMAAKMWEYNVEIDREKEGNDYYGPFKNILLEVAIRTNMIPYSIEYMQAVSAGWVAIEAFEFSRFRGIPVPHVDPVKEVTAERLKLGKEYDGKPLTSPEDSAERLNLGDLSQNIEEYKRNYAQVNSITEEV